MNLLTVDSSVLIDVIRGSRTVQTTYFLEQTEDLDVVVGDIVVCELLSGVRDEAQATRLDEWLRRYPTVEMVGSSIARTAARNYRILRRRGITIRKTIDVLIATWCIEEQVPLLHRDRDFEPFERHLGLRVLR